LKLGFGKPKQKDSSIEGNAGSVVANRLKELCGDDADLYGAMSRLMFLDPKKITRPLERVVSEAQDYEAQGNKMRAQVDYRIAGGISLFRGDADGVTKFFSKAASLAIDSHPEYQVILKRSTEAVSIARKYYEEFRPLVGQTGAS
jgi:hypothetical protein